jgi:hypothetical protein
MGYTMYSAPIRRLDQHIAAKHIIVVQTHQYRRLQRHHYCHLVVFARPVDRWLAGDAVPSVTASIAGLPATKAWVLVGPPLLASLVLRILAKAVGIMPLDVAVMAPAPSSSYKRMQRY